MTHDNDQDREASSPKPQQALSAADRDAARRAESETGDGVIRGEEVVFVTRGVSAEERAAVLATLNAAREEETNRVRAVKRRDREPWARSQRTPEGIGDLLGG